MLLLYVVNYYICRERYSISAIKSADVVLNVDLKPKDTRAVMLSGDQICRSQSEVHLGVDRNTDGSVDIEARVLTG